MKKSAFAFSAVVLCLLVACTGNDSNGGMSEKAKKNLENTRAVIRMFETGDFSKAGDHIAADGVDHSGPTGDVKGLDSITALFKQSVSMMSDAKREVVQEIADDNYSWLWMKQSWTAKTDDPMMGLKAGDRGNMESVEVCKHDGDGKITDHWGFLYINDVMKMMPQPQMPADTSKTK